jgi:hypothetical protein
LSCQIIIARLATNINTVNMNTSKQQTDFRVQVSKSLTMIAVVRRTRRSIFMPGCETL